MKDIRLSVGGGGESLIGIGALHLIDHQPLDPTDLIASGVIMIGCVLLFSVVAAMCGRAS